MSISVLSQEESVRLCLAKIMEMSNAIYPWIICGKILLQCSEGGSSYIHLNFSVYFVICCVVRVGGNQFEELSLLFSKCSQKFMSQNKIGGSTFSQAINFTSFHIYLNLHSEDNMYPQ